MRKNVAEWVAAGLLLLAPLAARGDIYRWTDPAGAEHFTSDLSQVPAVQREAARQAARTRAERALNRAEGPPPPAPPSDLLAPPPPARSAPHGAPAPAAPGGHPEPWWREEHAAHAERVERARERVAQLEDEGADAEPPRMSSSRYTVSRRRHVAWKRATRELERSERQLEAFEERARRAGVPPGWLR